MARAKKNEVVKVKATKGELALQIAVLAVLVAIVTLGVVILVKFFQKSEETENPFDRFVIVNSTDVMTIIELNMGGNGGYENLQNTKASDLLMSDSVKDIVILFFASNISAYGDDADTKYTDLVNAIAHIDAGKNGDVLFLICDYSLDSQVLVQMKTTLGENHSMNVPTTPPSYLRIKQENTGTNPFTYVQNFRNLINGLKKM